MMFQPSREEVRRFFCDTWSKYENQLVLTPIENLALHWILEHPEYQATLADKETALSRDYPPDLGHTNPFLHLSMHLSIAEQISIDQPPGITQAFQRLAQRLDSAHEAHHHVMECLGTMLWNAQRNGSAPDGQAYIDCILQRAGFPPHSR